MKNLVTTIVEYTPEEQAAHDAAVAAQLAEAEAKALAEAAAATPTESAPEQGVTNDS